MQTNVLIVFYSRYGNTHALAKAIAEGARQIGDVNVRVRRAADLAPEGVIAKDPRWAAARKDMMDAYEEPANDDMEWADAIFFGTPTRYGNPTAEMKLVIDKTGPLWMKGALVDKVASVFVSTGTVHGGNESTILSMLNPLMHLGMIIVSPGYADPVMFSAGTPYGASSVSGPEADQLPTQDDLAAARFLGKRTTKLALMLKLGSKSMSDV